MTPHGRLRAARADSAASWIKQTIGPFGVGVRSLVPPIFAAYARILHPAWAADRTPVRWATVATWSARTAHSLAEFEPMARERRPPSGLKPFLEPPDLGALEPATLAALCDVVARHTTTPDQCDFGLWEGRGWIDWMVPGLRRAAKLELPERTYLLFEGPLSTISDIGWRAELSDGFDRRSIGLRERVRAALRPPEAEQADHRPEAASESTFRRESPNLIWPADRSWFVSSEIDIDSTFVGGSSELINDLLADSRLEAWPASPADPVSAASDLLNRP